ncbi:UNVERIFIED_CONTAM: hypothetical protein FKN15_047772, partial [Acipenser sinensis]
LSQRLKAEGLSPRDKYSNITDNELDTAVKSLHSQYPNAGAEMMNGYLRAKGIFVQRQRIRMSLNSIDPVSSAGRWAQVINRRSYHVPSPNSMWHMDGHMKLIRGRGQGYTGQFGLPRISVSRHQLQIFVSRGYTGKRIAEHLGCSVSYIYKRLKAEGLSPRDKYSNITDNELDTEVKSLHSQYPNAGAEMMNGYLRAKGIFVQRQRIRMSLNSIDPVSSAGRWAQVINRRSYHVPSPNHVAYGRSYEADKTIAQAQFYRLSPKQWQNMGYRLA